jgi:hypothetical protein
MPAAAHVVALHGAEAVVLDENESARRRQCDRPDEPLRMEGRLQAARGDVANLHRPLRTGRGPAELPRPPSAAGRMGGELTANITVGGRRAGHLLRAVQPVDLPSAISTGQRPPRSPHCDAAGGLPSRRRCSREAPC